MRVQLIRKFADVLNGIDLTNARVGDIVNVKAHEAAILVMEGWAREIERDAPPASIDHCHANTIDLPPELRTDVAVHVVEVAGDAHHRAHHDPNG